MKQDRFLAQVRGEEVPALCHAALLTQPLCSYSHGAAVCGVDEAPGEGAAHQAAPHWPRGWREGQHPEVRRGGRWRRRSGERGQEQPCNLSQERQNPHPFWFCTPCCGLCSACLGLGSFISFLAFHAEDTVWSPPNGSEGPVTLSDALLKQMVWLHHVTGIRVRDFAQNLQSSYSTKKKPSQVTFLFSHHWQVIYKYCSWRFNHPHLSTRIVLPAEQSTVTNIQTSWVSAFRQSHCGLKYFRKDLLKITAEEEQQNTITSMNTFLMKYYLVLIPWKKPILLGFSTSRKNIITLKDLHA